MPRTVDLNAGKKANVNWETLKQDIKDVQDPKAKKLIKALFKIVFGDDGSA